MGMELVKVCLVLGPGRSMEVGGGYVVRDVIVVVSVSGWQAFWIAEDEGDGECEDIVIKLDAIY
jgi:hypothetical protein